MKVERDIFIRRSPTDIFRYITGIEHTTEWAAGVAQVQKLHDGPLRVGTPGRMTVQALGQRVSIGFHITECAPDTALALKTTSGPFPTAGRATFIGDGAGTRVTLLISSRIDNPIFRLAQGQFSRATAAYLDNSLRNLKDRLERSP